MFNDLIFDNLHDQFIIKNLYDIDDFDQFKFNISENGIKRLIKFYDDYISCHYYPSLRFEEKLIKIIVNNRKNYDIDKLFNLIDIHDAKDSEYIFNILSKNNKDKNKAKLLYIIKKYKQLCLNDFLIFLENNIEKLDDLIIRFSIFLQLFIFILVECNHMTVLFEYRYESWDLTPLKKYSNFQKERYKRGLKNTILPREIIDHILSFL